MKLHRIRTLPAWHLGKHKATLSSERPVISITFDDFPRSALDNGGPVMHSEGVAATFYTCFGIADTPSPSGPIGTLADLAHAASAGHEIGCHTYGHTDCSRLSAHDIHDSLQRNQATALALGIPALKHFSYPFGGFSLNAKKTIMTHYASARTTHWGINRGTIDLGMLKTVALYSRWGWDVWERYLQDLRAHSGWLIFYTHDVSAHPSAYGCTPEELKQLIGRARELGFDVLPVGAVIEKYIQTTHIPPD